MSAARQPLLAEHKDEQEGLIFTKGFIGSQQILFRQVCENAGLKVMTGDLEKTYLAPIVADMRKLQYSKENSVAEMNALIKKINDTRDAFARTYKNSFSTDTLNKMKTGFSELASHTKNYLKASYAGLAAGINSPAIGAEAGIFEAKLRKARDFCCILACVGWCPLENLLTICNWCGDGPCRGRQCCERECGPTNLANGHWSMWAPMGSIRSMKEDIAAQNEIIQQKAPIALTMI